MDREPDVTEQSPNRTRAQVHPTIDLLGAYSWRLLAMAAVLVTGAWLFEELRVVVVAVSVGLVVGRILDPVSRFLHRLGLPRPTSVALGLIAMLAIFIGSITLIGWAVAGEIAELGPTLEEGWVEIDRWVAENAPGDLSVEDVRQGREDLVHQAGALFTSQEGASFEVIATAAEVPTALILGIFLAFFSVKDHRFLLARARSLLPEASRARADDAARAAWSTLGSFLRSAALLGVIEGVIIGVTVSLVGGSLALPVAVLTFAAAFIPIVGAVVAGVIAGIVTLVSAGVDAALIVAVVAILVQQLDGDLLAPLVYGKMLQLHPIAVVLSVAVGGALLGLIGAVLAVPVLAVVVSATLAYRGRDAAELTEGSLLVDPAEA